MKLCLIVDDSQVVRLVARKILKELNFEITEAENGARAMETCKVNMPDAILLDWNMPGMSGIEFLRELRAYENGTSPMVVFCTTENDLSHFREAMGAGANGCIVKPFDSAIIRAKFAQIGLI